METERRPSTGGSKAAPGETEGVGFDRVLSNVDSGQTTPAEAIENLLGAQITLGVLRRRF
jgi:hypothetical protein